MVHDTQKRAKSANLTPGDIRRIREGLGLSQVEAGELLGGGPRAFTKYEAGTIKPAAAIAKLLRLLEADPTALTTISGRKVVPLDTEDLGLLAVTGQHVSALTDRKLANLTRRLLTNEAQSSNLPADGIHVAAVITAPDGGEDARIEWKDGPARTPFLPMRLTQFQIKATDISPGAAAADVLTTSGEIEPMVREALEAGGAYVILCSRPYTKHKIKKREARVFEALTGKGLSLRPEQIQFRDADQIAQWVNAHPPVAAWLLEQTQPGLVGPFRDWSHWAGRFEHESSPWVPDARLDPLRQKLREMVTVPRGVVRVVGLSGVGKSRLVLEALGPTGAEEATAPRLSDLVLYTVESEAGSTTVKHAVQSLADASIRAVIVVDRCVAETHQDLAAMVKRTSSRLSLITIDHEVPPTRPFPPEMLFLERASDAVIEGLVKAAIPNLPSEDQRKLVKLANGYPQMAHLLGQAWLKDVSITAASDDELIDRIVFGRKPRDRDLLREASMLLSVFGLLGAKDELTDLDIVAALTANHSSEDLREIYADLASRGVVQQRGRLITLQPRPVALALAERQWRRWAPSRWDQILFGDFPEHLRKRAAHQLSLLNQLPIASEITRHVCRPNGPVGNLEGLSIEGNTEILSSLAEIDGKAVVTLLDGVLGSLSKTQLKAIDGDVRRHIVWALQKIAFMAATFEQAGMLLLALAVSENESWGNNATGQFKALFPVFLAETEAGPKARLRLLDSATKTKDPVQMAIVVDALLRGATVDHFSRSVGSESHGSRPALTPWQPKLWKDAWDYVTQCLDRLSEIALRDDSIGARARAGLGHDFRGLIARGLLEHVERWVTKVTKAHRYWPEALNSLGDVLQYDQDGMKPGLLKRVRKMIAHLTPNAIADRVRFLVTEMPWDYPGDEKLEFEERNRRQVSDVENLVRELLKTPNEIVGFLPQLSVGSQRMTYAFGSALARFSKDPKVWQKPIMDAYASVSANERNLGLLSGYFSGLADEARVEKFKREAVLSKVFAPTLPVVCASIGIQPGDVGLVCDGLRTGLIPPISIGIWAGGRVLDKLSPAVLATLFNLLLTMSDEKAYSTALDLIGMYVFRNAHRLEELRPQLLLAAANVGVRQKRPGSQMDAHHFKQLVGWLLAKGRDDIDARAVAMTLAKKLALSPDEDSSDLIKPLLHEMLSNFSSIVWPVIGQAIVKDRATSWRLQHVLGDSFSFAMDKKPPILSLPEDILFAWCHAYPEVAPAFVATVIPVLATQKRDVEANSFHPLVKRLLDEFGDREGVLPKLVQNMYTFGWSGSRTTYYALYEQPLRSLESHPTAEVRRWAQKMLDSIHREIEAAENEDEERKAHWDL